MKLRVGQAETYRMVHQDAWLAIAPGEAMPKFTRATFSWCSVLCPGRREQHNGLVADSAGCPHQRLVHQEPRRFSMQFKPIFAE